MKIYLVDFENVKSKGLEGIDKLSETDNVIIFFSENSDTLSFEMHQKVLSSKADIEYFKVCVGGKNALDFQLSTLLGFMVAKEIYTHIFVISNDKGFDFLHSFWGGKYIDAPKTLVYRTKTIQAAIEYEEKRDTIEQEKLDETIAELDAQAETDEQEAVGESEQENTEAPEQAQTAEEVPSDESETQEKSQVQSKAKKEAKSSAGPKPKQAKNPQKEAAKKENDFNVAFKKLVTKSKQSADHKKVRDLFVSAQTLEEFHNLLLQKYKQKGTLIYTAIKPRFAEMKKKYAQINPPQADTAVNAAAAEDTPAQDRLTELLSGVCDANDIELVRRCIEGTASKKDFYISMVKQFQMKKGCEYYNAVKPHYNELLKKAQES